MSKYNLLPGKNIFFRKRSFFPLSLLAFPLDFGGGFAAAEI
ncbi:hypothetical protein [uncultured Chryseobacterium sp.]|nr:hypothetical protein [uncultured Chryseobacterium sp.]